MKHMSGFCCKFCLLCACVVIAAHKAHGISFDGSARTWPGGNVYYNFSTNVSAVEQKEFIDAASEWAMFANLHFIPQSTETNYITVEAMSPTNGEGGVSAVGMVGGQQHIAFSPSGWSRPVICHEIGHTLGCIHEQNRSDRDSYIQILWNNVTNGYGGFFIIINSRNPTVYDFHSIMHYGPPSGAIDPTQPTMIPLPAYSQFAPVGGDDPFLSTYDRAGMAAIYGPGPALSSVVTNTLDTGVGSLRAALYYAYDHPKTVVTFNIPTNDPGYSNGVFYIALTDQLPCLVNETTVDGTTQPGYVPGIPLIHLDGTPSTAAGRFASGLRIRGTNCIVRGLEIDNFQVNGILIDSGAVSNLVGGYTVAARNIFSRNGISGVRICGTNLVNNVMIEKSYTHGNVVAGNYIGIGSLGFTNLWGGLNEGVMISDCAQSNLVGGAVGGAGNVISGNLGSGVLLAGAGTQGNSIEGNYIGLNTAGSGGLPNGFYGVEIAAGASFNAIGENGAANVISGNTSYGINIYGNNTVGNTVQGNLIGLNALGTTGIGNGDSGIAIGQGASFNVIGGIAAGNVISGNMSYGVSVSGVGNIVQGNCIGLNQLGTFAIGNGNSGVLVGGGAHSNLIGGILAGNVISGNGGSGVIVADPGTGRNRIEGNYIGVDASGSSGIGNSYYGVEIYTPSNTVGGNAAGAGNVVSGNGASGIFLSGAAASGNSVLGNYVGLNALGTAAVGNGNSGITINAGASFNSLGGSGARNVISGNQGYGINIGGVNTVGNVVQDNFIGVNPLGTAAIGNANAGVGVGGGAQSNLIGGILAGNVISGNGGGVLIADAGTSRNTIEGNYIGVNAAGSSGIGNSYYGVEIYTPSNTIGGNMAGAGNVISGNGASGILLFGPTASGNVVQGNTIGLNPSRTFAVPNGGSGVFLGGGVQSTLVGGVNFGAPNLIAGNAFFGIELADAPTSNNTLRANSVYGNAAGFGIRISGGANRSIAAPALTSAVLTTNTTIIGGLTSVANTTFQIDFYSSPAIPAQGMTYLGATNVSTGAGGSVPFTARLSGHVPAGRIITATATDPAGNTSTMSGGVTVTAISTVKDGIPDAWRAQYFGGSGTTTNSRSCATCDADGTGMNNFQKFVAGLNPTNPASVLRLNALSSNPSNNVSSFMSAPGTVYRVLYRDDLASGFWSIAADQIVGTGTNIFITDPNVFLTPKRFYRLQVLW